MKRFSICFVILFIFACGYGLADTLQLPESVNIIEEEAFYGDTSLDEVALPEGITEIGEKAFSGSSLKKINLPDSLESIADNAFDRGAEIEMTAREETYGYDWAVRNGFIRDPSITPTENFNYRSNGDGTCTVTGYNYEPSGNLVIPVYSPDGDLVTEIGYAAFSDCSGFSGSLIIPDSVTVIGQDAFYRCSGFTGSLSIPDSVTSIGSRAFYGCSGFNGSLSLPDSLTFICSYAFYGCSGFNGSLSLPDSLTSIRSYAFYGCRGFNGSLSLPDSLVSIGSYAFSGCSGFNGSLSLPDSLVSIEGDHAFDGCSGLSGSLSLPNSLVSIGNFAFAGCSSFTGSLSLPDSLASIGAGAFDGCTGFSGFLAIPDSVVSIGSGAFRSCSALTGVSIPAGITSLSNSVFRDCSALTNISIPISVTNIGEYAFYGCTSLTGTFSIPEGMTKVNDFTFYHCSLDNILIPDSITEIGCWAFSGNIMTEVSLPEGISRIARGAFSDCENLKTFHVPDRVTLIEQEVFRGCSSLTDISIPSVTRIGAEAFSNCTSLAQITIPDCVIRIDEYAFSGCNSLLGILLPDGITNIRWLAFPKTTVIYSSVESDTAKALGVNGFSFRELGGNYTLRYDGEKLSLLSIDSGVTECNVPEGVNIIRVNSVPSSLEEIVFSSTVSVVEKSVFFEHTSLKRALFLSESVEINDYAFYGCTNLESLSFRGTVTKIGESAFSSCKALEALEIKGENCVIGTYAFTLCYNLETVKLCGSFGQIGSNVFMSCEKLANVVLPEGMTSIPKSMFYNCKALTELRIPSGITSVGDYAFNNCQRVKTCFLPDSLTDIGNSAFTFYNYSGTTVYCVENSPGWEYMSSVYYVTLIPWDGEHVVSLPDENEAVIQSVQFDSETIEAGMPIAFSVETSNAIYIQLIVDGEKYDTWDVDENGNVNALRVITLAGDRKVSFQAFGTKGAGMISQPTVIHVTSSGVLADPQVTCRDKIFDNVSQTVSWMMVPNANGYRLYLTHPDGQIDMIDPLVTDTNYHTGNSTDPFSYTWPAGALSETGDWHVMVMAYGKGYSQSSSVCSFTVYDGQEHWTGWPTGWPQKEKVLTYSSATAQQSNGYVDYLDPVEILGEQGNRYYILMSLTGGGTSKRWANNWEIGPEPYTPDVTVNGSWNYQEGYLVITVKTNLESVRAGINDAGGNEKGASSAYRTTGVYSKEYIFRLQPVNEQTSFVIWAENSAGTRKTKNLAVGAKPAETPVPDPTETPESPVVSPDPTPDPTPTPYTVPISEMVIAENEPLNGEHECETKNENGKWIHTQDLAYLEKFCLEADSNGTVHVISGICKKCGKDITCDTRPAVRVGFTLGSVAYVYSYYHNGGEGNLNDVSLKQIDFKKDLEINQDIDFHGADLIVNGKLTVKAAMTNVGNITCNQLQVDAGGNVSSTGKYISTEGGKLEIAANGSVSGKYITTKDYASKDSLSMTQPYGYNDLYVNGNIDATEIWARNINVSSTGTIHAETIGCLGAMKVKGTNFQFDGCVRLFGDLIKVDNPDVNYVNKMIFEKELIDIDSNNNPVKVYDISKSSVRVNGIIRYTMMTDEMEKYLFDTIFKGLKSDLKNQLHGKIGCLELLNAAKDFISVFADDISGVVTKEKCRSVLEPVYLNGEEACELEYSQIIMNKVLKSGSEYVTSSDDYNEYIWDIGSPVSNSSAEGKGYIKALGYGLMQDLFTVSKTKALTDDQYTLTFSQLQGGSSYTYDGRQWTLTLNPSTLKMEITVDAKHKGSGSVSVQVLHGYLEDHTAKEMVYFAYYPRNMLEAAYYAIMAAGNANAAAKLEKAVGDIFSDATTLINDCFPEIEDGLASIQEKVNDGLDSIFAGILPVSGYLKWCEIHYKDGVLSDIMADSDIEKELIKDFKEMFQLVNNMRKETLKMDIF